MENVGEKIYNLRKAKNISQEKLAEAVNVARQTVSKWERDVVQPTPQNFNSICNYFGVTLNYFFTDEEVMLIKAKIKETAPLPEESNDPPEALNELAATEAVSEKEPKLKMLKIISIVVAMVLLALCIVACGLAAYVLIAPTQSGQYVDIVDSVNYGGIAVIVVGVVALAVFITIAVVLIKKRIKNTKKK